MTEINGKYFYDLSTGKTVGIKHGQEVDGENSGVDTTTKSTTQYKGCEFDIIGANEVRTDGNYGTVEDLVKTISFEDFITLFIQGNLTPEELKIGLKAKGAINIWVDSIDNHNATLNKQVEARFNFNGKSYDIFCAVEAAESQIDDKTVIELPNHIKYPAQGVTYTAQEIVQTFKISQSEINEYFYENSNGSYKMKNNGILLLNATTHNLQELFNSSIWVNSPCRDLMELQGLVGNESGEKCIKDAVTIRNDGSVMVNMGYTATVFSASDVAAAKRIAQTHPEYYNRYELVLMDMGLARLYEEAKDRTEQYIAEHPNQQNIDITDVFDRNYELGYPVDPSVWGMSMIRGIKNPKAESTMLYNFGYFYANNGYGTNDDRVFNDFGEHGINPPLPITIENYQIWYREQLNSIRQAIDAGIDLVARFFPINSGIMSVEGKVITEQCFIKKIDDNYIYVTQYSDPNTVLRISIEDYINSMHREENNTTMRKYWFVPDGLLQCYVIDPDYKAKRDAFLSEQTNNSSNNTSQSPAMSPTDDISDTNGTSGSGGVTNPANTPATSGSNGTSGTTTPSGSGSTAGTGGEFSFDVNPGGYGSETVLLSNNRVPTTKVPANNYTDADVRAVKEEQMSILLRDIQVWSSDSYKDGDPTVQNSPIYQVEIDTNGNLIFGNRFKQSLKAYLEKKKHIDPSCMAGFLNLMGIPKNSVSSYLDDSAIDQLVSDFLQRNGSTDGETLTLEQYYDAIVSCDRGTSSYNGNKYYDKERIEATAEFRKVVSNMKADFPDKIGDQYGEWNYWLESMEVFATYGKTSTFNLDANWLDRFGEEEGGWERVLAFAAGVSQKDSNKTKEAKLIQLVEKMGGSSGEGAYFKTITFSMTEMVRYLVGNNPEHVNYFATMDNIEAAEYELMEQIRNNMENYSSDNVDTNIEVEALSGDKPIDCDKDLMNEIMNWIGDLTAPLYNKYYARAGYGGPYIYFEYGGSILHGNVDSSKNGREGLKWKNESDRQEFWKQLEALVPKILAKYGDVLTEFYFDGEVFRFKIAGMENAYSMMAGGTSWQNEQCAVYVVNRFEDTTDHPVYYTSDMKVYETKVPSKAPVDSNGDAMIPTKWPGIYTAKDGKVYCWDSVTQKYVGIHSYYGDDLLAGKYDDLMKGSQEEYDLVLPLLFGYNRTNHPGVYEKNGKFYIKSNTDSGRTMLLELDVVDPKTMQPITPPASSQPANAPKLTGNLDEAAIEDLSDEEIKALLEEEGYVFEDIEPQRTAESVAQDKGYTETDDGLFTKDGITYVWNPHKEDFEEYAVETDTSVKPSIRLRHRIYRLARRQNLKATTNPLVYKDKDGSYFVYKNGRFTKYGA